MKKRVWSFLIVLCLTVSMFPTVSVAADTAKSGDLTAQKPTIQQIQEAYQAVAPTTTNRFSEEPSITAPYSTGALTEEYLQNGLTFLNYVRYLAGLPSVQMTEGKNETAQYGAVLLAANDVLTHYPAQPADMDDAFYERGSDATSSSNLSMGYSSLQGAITGQMSDSSSANNLSCVGHRRWLLNPTLLHVGFGAAESASGRVYTDIPVFNRSGAGVEYQFIAWPASGYMPNHLMASQVPWSVTLNPSIYEIPLIDELTVTLKRRADGASWTFDSTTSDSPSENAYICIETSGYGVNNAIIFRPPLEDISNYIGTYTVTLDGLKNNQGEDASFTYDVTFFDIDTGSTEHSHSYGDPERVWSSDYQECNLEFTCETCGEKKIVPCEVTTTTTATCTTSGEIVHTAVATVDGTQYTSTVTRYVSATGHDNSITFAWSDDLQTCQATAVCSKCGEKQTIACQVTTSAANGTITYTATCTIDGKTYTDTRSVECTHDYKVTFAWSGDLQTCEATAKCSICGQTQSAACQVTTHVENGETMYTATCIIDGKTYTDTRTETEPFPFTDVFETDYYYQAVKWAVDNHVTAGVTTTIFSPGSQCTRAQIVTFLWNLNGKPEPKDTVNPFSDVTESDWFYQPILWAVQNNVTAGTSATTFSPNAKCTRAQVVTFLWNMNGQPKLSVSNPFKDVKTSDWYYHAIMWAVQNNVTEGTSATTFSPNQICTRGQVVTFLWNMEGKPKA